VCHSAPAKIISPVDNAADVNAIRAEAVKSAEWTRT
jgi:hypothetical protein